MKLMRGGCLERRQSGFAGIAVILILLATTTALLLLAPDFVAKATETRRTNEEQRLKEIADTLVTSIRLTGKIPGAADWAATVAAHAGMNQTNVEAVYPEFPSDISTRRVLLIDPALGAANLPYVQDYDGLSDGQTNLHSSAGRIMLISSTRRGLSLPVTNGPASSATVFSNIWNWGLDSATKAPPAGWSSAWTGKGDELHVQRIKLNELFHTAALSTALYSVGTNTATRPALSPVTLLLLDSTLLKVYETNGILFQAQRLTKDIRIEFASTNAEPPVVHFKFSELGWSVATNSGTYGSLWNGFYWNGVALGQTSLRPPAFPGFPANNYSAWFDGNRSYVETYRRYTNYLPGFTIAAWIAPAQFNRTTTYIAGIRDVANLNIYADKRGRRYVRLSTKAGGSLATSYTPALNEWHHVAMTASGSQLRCYIDGNLKGILSKSTANYYRSNLYTFRVGANPTTTTSGLSWGSYQYKGGIDEVVFYHRVLSTNEIKTLATGVLP